MLCIDYNIVCVQAQSEQIWALKRAKPIMVSIIVRWLKSPPIYVTLLKKLSRFYYTNQYLMIKVSIKIKLKNKIPVIDGNIVLMQLFEQDTVLVCLQGLWWVGNSGSTVRKHESVHWLSKKCAGRGNGRFSWHLLARTCVFSRDTSYYAQQSP